MIFKMLAEGGFVDQLQSCNLNVCLPIQGVLDGDLVLLEDTINMFLVNEMEPKLIQLNSVMKLVLETMSDTNKNLTQDSFDFLKLFLDIALVFMKSFCSIEFVLHQSYKEPQESCYSLELLDKVFDNTDIFQLKLYIFDVFNLLAETSDGRTEVLNSELFKGIYFNGKLCEFSHSNFEVLGRKLVETLFDKNILLNL